MSDFLIEYSSDTHMSPIAFCYSPHISKPTTIFGKQVFAITLGLDRSEPDYDPFVKTLKDFADYWKNKTQSPIVKNKCIYLSSSNNEYVQFTIKAKGQAIKCYNEFGEETEPPQDGDRVQVHYSLAGWRMGKEAGIKVYLNSVTIYDRTGKPNDKRNEEVHNEDDGEDWF